MIEQFGDRIGSIEEVSNAHAKLLLKEPHPIQNSINRHDVIISLLLKNVHFISLDIRSIKTLSTYDLLFSAIPDIALLHQKLLPISGIAC